VTITPPRPPQVEMPGQAAPRFAPEKEVRIAVVLYGGVSLAIYMYGVVRELWSMVRATAPERASSDDPDRSPDSCAYADTELSGAEPVYRLLGQMLGDDDVDVSLLDGGPTAADAPVRTRFVVDVLSGTSAGGINGIALAMALANETDLTKLARVWLETADIGKLIEPDSPRDGEQQPRPLRSLLNSTLMYEELVKAFADLTIPEQRAQQHPSRLVDDLDLAVTTTDLLGVPSSLGLDREQVLETAHNTVFGFRYGTPYSIGDVVNDFTDEDLQFLAYSARCTSSFPLAFEPMRLDTVYSLGLSPDLDSSGERWRRFWRPYESQSIDPQFRYRPFTDGGVLDNKPFSLATAALRQRRLDLPVERRLFYVEPSPERAPAQPLDGDEPAGPPTLPVLRATKMAAWDLRGAEPIRADLDRLAERNARLHEMDVVLQDLELRARPDDPPDARTAPSPDAGQIAHHRLRVDLVTERLASVLRSALGVDPRSAVARGLDALLQAWRTTHYEDDADFLAAFDVQSELRRLTHLEQRLRTLSARTQHGAQVRSARGLAEPRGAAAWEELRSEARSCAAALGRATVPLRGLAWGLQDPVHAAELARTRGDEVAAEAHTRLVERLQVVREALAAPSFARLVSAPWAEQPRIAAELLTSEAPLVRACDGLAQVVDELIERARCAAREAEQQLWSTGEESGLVGALRWYERCFTTFDRILLPLVFGTELGEARPVQVNRISPLDSKASGRGEGTRLFGESYGHFGAFLREDWRRLDLVSGRLDGASKIITALLPADSSAIDELIERAHIRILEEEYGPGGLLRELGEQPAGGDLREAFWQLRRATPAKHEMKAADVARHGQKVVPSLRASIATEVRDPWGARMSSAIGVAWQAYRTYAGVSSARQRAQTTVQGVASRVRNGPAALRRWITGRSR
jgi:patatin-related protein